MPEPADGPQSDSRVADWVRADLELERVHTEYEAGRATRAEYDQAAERAAEARAHATH